MGSTCSKLANGKNGGACDDDHPLGHYSSLLEVTHSNLNANIIEDAYTRVG
ncbi:hypothetical protein [Thalassolituus sp.]|uniref:hypothetical protein n=1 Tax=Thalassolituus sp. TaxID=2030822 RepID=UPI00351904EF